MKNTLKRLLFFSIVSFALPAAAQDRIKIRVGSLTLPVVAPVVANAIKEKGFDAKNGLDLEIKPFPSISGYYAALATGDVDVLLGGANVLHKMRSEGARATIVATAMRLSDLVIVTTNPAIRSLADLKGKQLAADMGSQQYQVAAIYAQAKGISLGKDVTVVQASFALARGQLAAGRVDAAMVIEPIATAMLKENPQLGIIFNGSAAWQEITGQEGWELLVMMNEDFIKKHPDAPKRYIAAMRDFASFIHKSTDEADRIAVSTVKLGPGILKEAVASGRWKFEAHPAWGPERKVIWDMFERAVAAKFADKLPDPGIIYAP
jgi:ABC-type nitrate/sulfonate/bicarbonate transport system substrate-binding protein